MTKKDYERAATIAQELNSTKVAQAFATLFRDDNPRFDEARFRAACVPGANVKARPRKSTCQQRVCFCHDTTIPRTGRPCSHCGCSS